MENTSIKEQLEAQNVIQQMNNKLPNSAPQMVNPDICPQCGLLHPPVKPGEKCAMAPITTKDNKVIDPTEFLTKMKFLISNQLEQKGVKDTKKFFQYLTIKLMKLMENYTE